MSIFFQGAGTDCHAQSDCSGGGGGGGGGGGVDLDFLWRWGHPSYKSGVPIWIVIFPELRGVLAR